MTIKCFPRSKLPLKFCECEKFAPHRKQQQQQQQHKKGAFKKTVVVAVGKAED